MLPLSSAAGFEHLKANGNSEMGMVVLKVLLGQKAELFIKRDKILGRLIFAFASRIRKIC